MGPSWLGLSAIDKRETWSRWKVGQTLHEIGRVYGKCHNAIRALLLPRACIPPLARRRSPLALTFSEREDISRGLAAGSSIREIACCLHRAASTVSREIARHGGRATYRAYDADQQAWNVALRPKRCLLAVNSELRDVVAALSEHVRQLPSTLRRSLTWDRGLEMAKHTEFTVATDVRVYVFDPQSPWQRGLEREYQSATAAILPPRDRSGSDHSSAARPGLAALESKTHKNFRIQNSSE